MVYVELYTLISHSTNTLLSCQCSNMAKHTGLIIKSMMHPWKPATIIIRTTVFQLWAMFLPLFPWKASIFYFKNSLFLYWQLVLPTEKPGFPLNTYSFPDKQLTAGPGGDVKGWVPATTNAAGRDFFEKSSVQRSWVWKVLCRLSIGTSLLWLLRWLLRWLQCIMYFLYAMLYKCRSSMMWKKVHLENEHDNNGLVHGKNTMAETKNCTPTKMKP